MNRNPMLKNITKIAILAAFAGVLNLFTVPLPFFPQFYEMDLSDVVVLIGGFNLGPWAAVLIEAIKQLINIAFNGSITAFVGEIANFLMGIAFVLPAAFIYQKKKSYRRALIGLTAGLASLVLASAFLNYFVLIPAYAKAFGMEVVMVLAQKVIPSIVDLKTLVLFATVPFNLLKGLVCSGITLLLYKRISPLLRK